MQRFIATFLLLVCCLAAYGQGSFSEKKKLHDLLDKRKAQFEVYLVSLNKKSGLFGSRTKNDLRNSTRVIKEIVETDNHIIRILNRAIDFKLFEKSQMNYDILERDQQLEKIRGNAVKLQNQLEQLKAKEASKNRIIRIQGLLMLLLVSALIILYYYKIKKE